MARYQSSRPLSLAEAPRMWWRSGEEGRDVERPRLFALSNGFGTESLSVDRGVFIGSIVVFS